MNREPKPAGYFAETAVGAVTIVAFQFLSLLILVGGLVVLGVREALLRFTQRGLTPQ